MLLLIGNGGRRVLLLLLLAARPASVGSGRRRGGRWRKGRGPTIRSAAASAAVAVLPHRNALRHASAWEDVTSVAPEASVGCVNIRVKAVGGVPIGLPAGASYTPSAVRRPAGSAIVSVILRRCEGGAAVWARPQCIAVGAHVTAPPAGVHWCPVALRHCCC